MPTSARSRTGSTVSLVATLCASVSSSICRHDYGNGDTVYRTVPILQEGIERQIAQWDCIDITRGIGRAISRERFQRERV